jgi:hypothetical protein
MCRSALRVLGRRGRIAWLHPDYGNDFVVGSAFLCFGAPMLILLGYLLVRARRRA